ncbi:MULTISPECIES: SRPBCC family protein [Streptomyces]|uniref:Carbon monoxide dehydrogenase n=1 Tax=Streptomyces dengpaensis TaxID=2049881 RepID=A0ABM6SK07_9ACTN|nr:MULTISPECIES: SRPBCC family protein [Streptomyces]AVH54952.1 carbon monoxide dehydrogenase [Streptomyces dengpaensis]PIB08252.1 carbon monoxide dehydrogenase [Streptomyces sp. HG99]
MELHHEFTVPVPVQDAWRVLLDIERVAPCMPGATVEDYDGKTVTGSVKVKVGPITVTYRGTGVFEEQDEETHRMVLIASGKETRGQGTARARVTGTLSERDGGTAVSVDTDLTVTGRPAQFGRGVMAEVGDKLVGQFADCLSQRLEESQRVGESGRRDDAARLDESGRRDESGRLEQTELINESTVSASSEPEPIDLLRTAGVPVAKRLVAGFAAVAAAVLVISRLRRRTRR